MSDQGLSVTFSATCEEAGLAGCQVFVEHDDLLNNGSSSFELGETIFYRAFPAGQYSITPSNGGTGVVRCAEAIIETSEKITFNGKKTANLSHPLHGSFSYTWVGNAIRISDKAKILPNISATKNSTVLTLKEAVYGTVSVVYEYCYSSLSFTPINSGEQTILFCRFCESTEEYVCASMLENIEDVQYEEVTLAIVNACESGEYVAGAQVIVDGELIETVSGEDGKIHLGVLTKGEHSIVVTAPGYVSSADDSLSNDSIDVE